MGGRGCAALKIEVSPGEAIRLALAARGHTFASIARDLGVTRPAVSGTAHGHFQSHRILSRIADLLGVPVTALRGRALTTVSVARRERLVNVGLSAGRRQRRARAGARRQG